MQRSNATYTGSSSPDKKSPNINVTSMNSSSKTQVNQPLTSTGNYKQSSSQGQPTSGQYQPQSQTQNNQALKKDFQPAYAGADKNQNYNSMKKRGTFSEKPANVHLPAKPSTIWEQCVFYINKLHPNIMDLMQFFEPYDVWPERIFENYELQEIFPEFTDRDIAKIFEEYKLAPNQNIRTRNDEIPFVFILDRIDDTRYIPFSNKIPPKKLTYFDRPITENIRQMLATIAEDRNVQRAPERSFEDNFGDGPCTCHMLESWLRQGLNIRRETQDYIDLCNYFNSKDRINNSFSQIMFVRAMKYWYENYDAQGKLLKPLATATQVKATVTTTPASQTTTITTPASQTTTTQAVQAKPVTTTPAATTTAKVVVTTLPDDVERIVERIGQFLVQMNSKNLMLTLRLEPQRHEGQNRVIKSDFIRQIQSFSRQGLTIDNNDATLLANHFTYKPTVKTDAIEWVNYQDLENAVFDQMDVFKKFVETFTIQLFAIREALKKRISGVHKWFQLNAANGKEVNDMEFGKALQSLNITGISQADSKKMFDALDWDKNGKVLITTIDSAFKFYDRQKKEQFAPIDDICTKILNAFNVDEQFINDSLKVLQKQDGLELSDFVSFFIQMPTSVQYYSTEELLHLGEHFVNERGTVDFVELARTFLNNRMTKGLRKDVYKKGIHELPKVQQAVQTSVGFNPLLNFAQFSANATQASQQRLQTPYDFFTNNKIDSSAVEAIVKGLFLKGQVAFDYFNRFRDMNQRIEFQKFFEAVNELNVDLKQYLINDLFFAILWFEHQRRDVNFCTPKKLDEFIHFACQKTLEQMHDQLLLEVNSHVIQNPSNTLEFAFQRFSQGGQQNCSLPEFQNAVNTLNPRFTSQVDYLFLFTRYVNPATPNMAFYPQFLGDVKNISFKHGGQNQSLGGPAQSQFQNPIVNQQYQAPLANQGYQNPQTQQQNVMQPTKGYNINQLIAKFVFETNKLKTEVARQLTKDIGNKNTMPKYDFQKQLDQLARGLTIAEQDELTRVYTSKFNDREVDIYQFLEDYKSEKKSQEMQSTPQIAQQPGFIAHPSTQILPTDPNFIKWLKKQDIDKKGTICQRLEQAIEQVLIKYNVSNFKLTQSMFHEVLSNLSVFLDRDQGNEYNQWFRQLAIQEKTLQGVENVVEAQEVLKQMGIQSTKFAKKQPSKEQKTRRLTDEELLHCHQMCLQIKSDLLSRNLTVEAALKSFGVLSERVINPPQFKNLLFQHNVLPEETKQKLNNKMLGNLIFYLAREEKAKVSIQKLRLALDQRNTDKPLQQEQIEQELKIFNKMMTDLTSGSVPAPVRHLLFWIDEQKVDIKALFGYAGTGTPEIKRNLFDTKLQEAGYVSIQPEALHQSLETTGGMISLKKLQDFQLKVSGLAQTTQAGASKTQMNAQNKIQLFEPMVRDSLNKLSQYLKTNKLTVNDIFGRFDRDGDLKVSREEFISGITQLKDIAINQVTAKKMFDAIDLNHSDELSFHEFGMHIEGVQQSFEQRKQKIPKFVYDDMKQQILQAFREFDKNNDGKIDASEIMLVMKTIGNSISKQQAIKMIEDITEQTQKRRMDHLLYPDFEKMCMDKLVDKLISAEDKTSELRRLFKEADTDYSGFLTADEVYGVLLKLKIDIRFDELVELMSEFEIDGDARMDIDEFISMMTCGEDLTFCQAKTSETFFKIKQGSSGFNFGEIFKQFSSLPLNFIPSFFNDQAKTPSASLKAQVDPQSMEYKDLEPNFEKKTTTSSYIQPFDSLFGCDITIEGAEGVPIPAGGDFRLDQIVRRLIRVGLFDNQDKKFVFNTSMVRGEWNEKEKDKWSFRDKQNPILFRTTAKDGFDKKETADKHQFIFEMVVFVRHEEAASNMGEKQYKIKQYSCGYAIAPFEFAKRNISQDLDLLGGSPFTSIEIAKDDIKAERGFLQNMINKTLNTQIKSKLVVKFATKDKWNKETKTFVDLLPSTCFVNKNMLQFVAGYRNYAGSFLDITNKGPLIKPTGDVVMSCFPQIMDNVDIYETLTRVWVEDVLDKKQPTNVDPIAYFMQKTTEYIRKLWPVLFSEEVREQNPIRPKTANQTENLQSLVVSALRFNHEFYKTDKKIKAPETLTFFKPFNIKEMEFEVMDTYEAQQNDRVTNIKARRMTIAPVQMSNSIQQPVNLGQPAPLANPTLNTGYNPQANLTYQPQPIQTQGYAQPQKTSGQANLSYQSQPIQTQGYAQQLQTQGYAPQTNPVAHNIGYGQETQAYGATNTSYGNYAPPANSGTISSDYRAPVQGQEPIQNDPLEPVPAKKRPVMKRS